MNFQLGQILLTSINQVQLFVLLSKNHEFLADCEVQNYETIPTGITSI
jgi:hypothetical protein